jgi:hypothetical protein
MKKILLSILIANSVTLLAVKHELIDLQGNWKVAKAENISAGKYKICSDWRSEIVPHKWPFGHWRDKKSHCMLYRKSFVIKDLAKKSFRLSFDDISHVADIFLNGKFVKQHYSNTPFCVDVSEFIKKGSNRLDIYITDWFGLIKNSRELKQRSPNIILDKNTSISRDNKWGGFITPFDRNERNTKGIIKKAIIEILPDIYIKRVKVKTSFRDKRISIRVTVHNNTSKNFNIRICSKAKKNGKVENTLSEQNILITAGCQRVVTLLSTWKHPALWSYEAPTLYDLETRIFLNGKLKDESICKFGFRELWIGDKVRNEEPGQFYLNGLKVKLKHTVNSLYHKPYKKSRATAEEDTRFMKEANINVIRYGFGFPDYYYQAADEQGMLINVVFPIHMDQHHIFDFGSDLFWENARKQLKEMLDSLANHPSVLFISLTNEAYHGDPKIKNKYIKKLEELYDFARNYDDSRIYMFDGDGDMYGIAKVYNLHGDPFYPSRAGCSSAAVFPESQHVFLPDSARRLERTSGIQEGANWKWRKNKPLYLGESPYGQNMGHPASFFVGDKLYCRDMHARSMDATAIYWGITLPVLRSEDISAIGPFGLIGGGGDPALPTPRLEAVKEAFKPVTVQVKELDKVFYSDKLIKRTIFIYNDTFKARKLQLVIEFADFKASYEICLAPGCFIKKIVKIKTPQVESRERVDLKFILSENKNIRKELKISCLVYPKIKFEKLTPVLLYDNEEKTERIFKTAQIPYRKIKNVKDINEHLKDQVLVIATNSLNSKGILANRLKSLAFKGMRILILQQNHTYISSIPVISPALSVNSTSICFKRSSFHPVLNNITNEMLKFWHGGKDSAVSTDNLIKPYYGNFGTIIDAGGAEGLLYTPLLEVYCGPGILLLSQLELTDKILSSPVAAIIMKNIIAYMNSYKYGNCSKMSWVAPHNTTLAKALKMLNLNNNRLDKIQLDGCNVLVISGDEQSLSKLLPEKMKLNNFVKNGGIVLFNGITPESIKSFKAISGISLNCRIARKHDYPLQIKTSDPLTESFSNYDMFWDGKDITLNPYMPKLTQSIMKYKCSEKTAKELIAPGALLKFVYGKGAWIINQVLWDQNLRNHNKEKAIRYFSKLITNLNIRFPISQKYRKKDAVLKNTFFLDLSKIANMGFIDEKADDGEGGWTDQGPSNDFNGFNSGKKVFNNIPFKIIDPKLNNGKACIVLRSVYRPAMPLHTDSVSVNRKVDSLYFLHTGAWVGDKKGAEVFYYEVVFNDTDGTRVKIPVKCGINISDWWRSKHKLIGAYEVNAQVGRRYKKIYIQKWKNHYRNHPIKEIRIISNNLRTVPIILGITGTKIK